MAMLQVTDLKVNYGVIQAIKGVSFEVNVVIPCLENQSFVKKAGFFICYILLFPA